MSKDSIVDTKELILLTLLSEFKDGNKMPVILQRTVLKIAGISENHVGALERQLKLDIYKQDLNPIVFGIEISAIPNKAVKILMIEL